MIFNTHSETHTGFLKIHINTFCYNTLTRTGLQKKLSMSLVIVDRHKVNRGKQLSMSCAT